MKIKGISNFCQGPGQVQVRMRGLEKDYGGGLGLRLGICNKDTTEYLKTIVAEN